FRRGVAEHAVSDAPELDLGRSLLARRAVGSQALEDASRVRDAYGGDLVAALVALKLLDPAASYRALQEHGIAVLAAALLPGAGTARWFPGAQLPVSAFPLGSRLGLIAAAARRLPAPAVRALLGDRAGRIASRSGGR